MADMLSALAQSKGVLTSPSELRLATSCLQALAAFLHLDKLAKLRRLDIFFRS